MKLRTNSQLNAVSMLILLLSITGVSVAQNGSSEASNTDKIYNLYRQPNGGEYWWIANNTRRWLSGDCARKHQNAGAVTKVIQYSELVQLSRDDGSCPAIRTIVDVPQPAPVTSEFYQQSNDGEYWWIKNNTRRWMSRDCAQTHKNAGAVAKIIQYAELVKIVRDSGSCPAVGGNEPEPRPEPVSEKPMAEKYRQNLSKIRQSSVRNLNHDNSIYRNTPSVDLVITNHLGPRSEYLGDPGGNIERAFPVIAGGQNRTGCEFSHFAYDDPLVHPNKPGAAHLHMFFGNTDVNAYSTYETLINSGSSTCNGQELNRTGYWAPAMFDGNDNVRIPERIVVYYKGEGLARGISKVYPEGAAMVTDENINAISYSQGGALGKFSFVCSDQYSGASAPASNSIPNCDGDRFWNEYGVSDNPHVVLEMNVKFPQCWNRQDPSNPDNFLVPEQGSWYYSSCGNKVTLPNLEYFINYRVELGEDTSSWYLSSDVDPMTYSRTVAGGSTVHADWWGGWNKEVNQSWIDNCVNYKSTVPSGCGFGYLSDGGPDGSNPRPGPALKYRPQYTGPSKVPAERLFSELCETTRSYNKEEDAAYCNPSNNH